MSFRHAGYVPPMRSDGTMGCRTDRRCAAARGRMAWGHSHSKNDRKRVGCTRRAGGKSLPVGVWVFIGAVGLLALGCQPASQRPAVAETRATPAVDAWVDPPAGWRLDRSESDIQHAQAVWVSPSGATAYGVIVMYLPFPMGSDLILWGFLNRTRQMDHEAKLLEREDDPKLPGLRFVALAGTYKLRVNLIVHGWRAWAVYAGSLRAMPDSPAELDLAEEAREGTRVGLTPPAEIVNQRATQPSGNPTIPQTAPDTAPVP